MIAVRCRHSFNPANWAQIEGTFANIGDTQESQRGHRPSGGTIVLGTEHRAVKCYV